MPRITRLYLFRTLQHTEEHHRSLSKVNSRIDPTIQFSGGLHSYMIKTNKHTNKTQKNPKVAFKIKMTVLSFLPGYSFTEAIEKYVQCVQSVEKAQL